MKRQYQTMLDCLTWLTVLLVAIAILLVVLLRYINVLKNLRLEIVQKTQPADMTSMLIQDNAIKKNPEPNLKSLLEEKTSELEDSEQVYGMVFNGSPLGIGFANLAGRVINANPAFCKMFGYKLDELKALSIADITNSEDFEKELVYLESLLSGEIESFKMPKRMISKIGATVEVNMTVSTARNKDGSLKFIFALVEDVTDRNANMLMHKEQEKIMIQQSRMAAMGEMISSIAHQWRQPLNTLGILIQDAAIAYSYGEINEQYMDTFAKDTMKQVEFMSTTIDNFRGFFKPDKTTEVFLIVDYIEEISSMFKSQFLAYGITIDILTLSEPRINGLKHEFGQVILNIINNAKDALIENKIKNPSIVIDIIDLEDEVAVSIKDNAHGIPEHILESIFDPYFTTKDESKGTGIGLYIAKIIIETHMNGTLKASNDKDGAMFEIVLPKNLVKMSNIS